MSSPSQGLVDASVIVEVLPQPHHSQHAPTLCVRVVGQVVRQAAEILIVHRCLETCDVAGRFV
jgi:hypothetical protein